ncbi:CDP-glycerol glycerophosphotransferase family protein [Mammaliicoccus sciuri]|uniref:CDP-glycerol glycerophosphotransferase family protein n=1 Tax=Mammaliicoccus TaxID=2803850 RepID=UPI0018CA0D81|nr:MULTISPECIES: CDP-glycerol glycerophosphotransferase family protein [Mammaliicoccus]MBG9209189.1 CDP-glycerol glycerophosphotransferase family protein [Mammaliicoccus sciuri]MDT0744076.1 CDP-glycerol glycerophosphotransferase family protein [Mammaliicoccus sciuri]MDT0750950.1 CDP-glycerol glycerophosphotransferase family protein [Mammaliicoccus sciuri]
MKNIEILSNAKNEKYDYYKKKYESTLKNNNNQRIIEKYNQYCNGDIKENCILYETFHGKSMTDNPYALFESLILDPEYKNYRHIWVINTLTSETEKYKNNENVIFVKVNSDEYLYYLAKAKYLINNTSFPPYFCKRKNQVYLNTWHGTPLKTLGIDMNGPIDQLKNIQRNFLQTDYLLSPNEFTTEKLVYSHNLDGIYTGEILEVGYPRIDLITKTNSKDILDKLRQYIEIDTNKKVALYAPTWRGNVGKEVDIKKEVKDIIVSIKNNLDSNYQLLLKVHPLLYKYFKNDKDLSKIFIPDSIDISETLSIVDLLITDYSSVFFDFYIKNKPIILYTYDKAEYLSDRGTYLDFDELNTYVAENETELKELIANVDILKGCKNESFISLQNGNVSKTVIDIVFKNNKNEKVKKVNNEKKNVLFYIDNLTDNNFDKKAAYINEYFDRQKYNILILVKSNLTFEEELQIKKLVDVKIFFRFGNLNTSEKSWIEYMIAMDIGYVNNNEQALNILSRNELRRLLGSLEIHNIFNLSNNKFWQIILGFYSETTGSKYQLFDQKIITKIQKDKRYYHNSFINKFEQYISFDIEAKKYEKDYLIEYINLNLIKFDKNNNKSIKKINDKDIMLEIKSDNLKEKYIFIKDFNFTEKYIFIDVEQVDKNEVNSFYNIVKNQRLFDDYKIVIYGLELKDINEFNELIYMDVNIIPLMKNNLDYLTFAKHSNYMFVLEDFKNSMDKIDFLQSNGVNVFVTDNNELLGLMYKDYLSIYEWKTFLPMVEKYSIESNIYN